VQRGAADLDRRVIRPTMSSRSDFSSSARSDRTAGYGCPE
jgi:hypothetical protein